jgi:hypothetical protein
VRQLFNRAAHEALVEIIKDYEAAEALVELSLFIDGRDFSELLQSGDVSGGSDAVAWSMGATLATKLEGGLENSPVRLDAYVGGIPVAVFRGYMPVYQTSDEGFQTDIVCATPGYLLDKIRLREHTDYNGRTPQAVLRDAFYRNPLYDRGQVRIPRFETPVITMIGSEGFEDAATPADVMAAVAGALEFIAFDDVVSRGVKVLRAPGPMGEGSPIVWEYQSDGRDVKSWASPRFATPDEQYRTVIVRALLDDGSYRVAAERPVNHKRLKYPPVEGQILYVDWEGVGQSDAEADDLATKIARELAGGRYVGDTEVAWNPLLEPGDTIVFRETAEDESGFYAKTWRCQITGLSSPFGETLSTGISYDATLALSERLADPPIRVPGLTPGNIPARLLDFVVTVDDECNLILNLGRTFNSLGQRWAGVDEDGNVWIDPDLAEEWAGIDEETGELWVDPRLGPAVGLLADGTPWVDPDRAIGPSGCKWAGLDEDGELWVDPELSGGIAEIVAQFGLFPSDDLFPSEGLFPEEPSGEEVLVLNIG